MALSGSVNTSKYDGRYLQLSWTATQNASNNTSTISWTLKAVGGYSSWYNTGPVTVTIDGATVYNQTSRKQQYTGTIATGTKTITHNSDGTKTFAVAVRAAIYSTSVNCTGSANFTLNALARTPNAPTKMTITAGNGNFVGLGDTVTMNWSGASGTITGYQIRYCRGNSGWKDYKTINTTATSGSATDSFTSTDIGVNGAGNDVQYAVRTMNGSLASAWCFSNKLQISGGIKIKVNGTWKMGSVWIKVNGTWKRAKRVYIKQSNAWKQSI